MFFIPVAMWAGFITYAFSLEFFSAVIPIPEERSLIFSALIAHGFLAAAVVSGVFSYPIAIFYRKAAVAVALLISVPVSVLLLPELSDFSRHPYTIIISGYHIFAYLVLLVAGVWLAHAHVMGSNIAVKRDTPQAARPLP